MTELLNDYEDYMRTRHIKIWDQSHPRFANLINTCRKHNDTAYYTALASRLNDEEYCNLMLTLINQAITMLNKMIDLIKTDFIKNGGVKEQMYAARLQSRSSSYPRSRENKEIKDVGLVEAGDGEGED